MAVTFLREGNGKSLSALELATVAGVSRRHVDHMLECKVMPDSVRVAGPQKRFSFEAAIVTALDSRLCGYLTLKARKLAYEHLASEVNLYAGILCLSRQRAQDRVGCTHSWMEGVQQVARQTAFIGTGDSGVAVAKCLSLIAGPVAMWMPESDTLVLDTMQRISDLLAAEDRIISDPDILSGTPVIKGTRVPAHAIAAAVEAGTPKGEILETYPSISEQDVDIAHVWSKAHPRVGRPKRTIPEDAVTVRVPRKRMS